MDGGRPILRVGLTGGIASGKTTVAGFMAEMGAYVLDADRIAHEVMAAGGSAHHAVVDRFGERILAPDGDLDRAALARLVFSDPSERESLNAIVHPKVIAETERRLERYRISGHSPIAVVDAALLVESGYYKRYDRLVVVRCGRDAQIQRLRSRSGLSPEEAVARIESQAGLEEKLSVADYIIDTDATIRETRRETEQVYARLLQDFERRHGAPGSR